MRNDRLLLKDTLDAINLVIYYTPPTLAAFHSSPPIQSQVLRHITIIGEVANRLHRSFREATPAIPWGQIIAMRNTLVDDYHVIDWDRVYQTALRDVRR